MKAFIKFILLAILFVSFSCTSSSEYKFDKNNPCSETRFIILKSRPDSTLSEAERKYINQKQSECDEHSGQDQRKKDKAAADKTFIIILSSIVVIFGLAALIALQFPRHGHW